MALLPPFSSLTAYTSAPASTVSGPSSSSSSSSSSAIAPLMSQHPLAAMGSLPHQHRYHDQTSAHVYHETQQQQQQQQHYGHYSSPSFASSSSSSSSLPSPPSSSASTPSSTTRFYPSPSDTLAGNAKLSFTHSNIRTPSAAVKMDSYHPVDAYSSHQAAAAGQHYEQKHHHHPQSTTSYTHGFPSPAFSSASSSSPPSSSSSSSSSAQAQASSSSLSSATTLVQHQPSASSSSSSSASMPAPHYPPQDMALSFESINVRLLSEALQREGFADLGNWIALTQQQHEVMALTMQQQQQPTEQSLLPPSPVLTTTTTTLDNTAATTAYPAQQTATQQQSASNPVYQGLQEYANVAPFVQTADELQFNLIALTDNSISPFPGTLFNNEQTSIETTGFLLAAGKDELSLGAFDPLAALNSHQFSFPVSYGSQQQQQQQQQVLQQVSDGGPGSSSSAHPPSTSTTTMPPFLNGTGLDHLFQFDPKLEQLWRSTTQSTSYFPEDPEFRDSDSENGGDDNGDFDPDVVPALVSDDAPTGVNGAAHPSPALGKRTFETFAQQHQQQQHQHLFGYPHQQPHHHQHDGNLLTPYSAMRNSKQPKMSKAEQKQRHSHSRNNSMTGPGEVGYDDFYHQQQHALVSASSSSPRPQLQRSASDDEGHGSPSSSSSSSIAHLPKTIEKRVHHCTVPGCDKAFTRAFNLRSHLNTHNGERPHKCPHDDCNWDFVRRHDLDRHIKSKHMPDKPYACTKCTSRFGRSDALQRHRRLEGH